jgi:hypothetical protein
MLALLALQSALAAPPGLTLAPFGVGVYAHGKPLRGVVYSVTQAGGIATVAAATSLAYDAAEVEDDASFATWQAVGIAGVSVAAVSYLASVLDGARLHELEKEGAEARRRVEAWDAARATSVGVR